MVSKIKYLAIASVIALSTASGAFAQERGGLSPAYSSPDGEVFLQNGRVPMVDSRYMPEDYIGLGELLSFDEVFEIPIRPLTVIPEAKGAGESIVIRGRGFAPSGTSGRGRWF